MQTRTDLVEDLKTLGVEFGDALFVHASMKAVGPVAGGARTVIEALQEAVGSRGLLAMPGFSDDAYFPPGIDRGSLSQAQIQEVERAVPGYDSGTSPAAGMGVIAETFRTWPGTIRSAHPAVSVCLNGAEAERYVAPHSAAWATGANTPLGHLAKCENMHMLLIGVGWNRCSLLHTAEALAEHRRVKTRRFKTGPGDAPWREEQDVADDLGRHFPAVGAAYEDTGAVTKGWLGQADVRFCDYAPLLTFARDWINAENLHSGAVA